MKKLAALGALAALALAAPAQAKKPDTAGQPAGSAKAERPAKAKSTACAARSVGFNASGRLLSSTLTTSEAGRYSGTITVRVTRANHGAPAGDQTYTLTNARVRFGTGVDAAAPAAGSRVKLSGKVTKLARKCSTDGFTPAATVKKVDVRAPKALPAQEPAEADASEA